MTRDDEVVAAGELEQVAAERESACQQAAEQETPRQESAGEQPAEQVTLSQESPEQASSESAEKENAERPEPFPRRSLLGKTKRVRARDRAIYEQVKIVGRSQKDVAAEFKISQPRVSQVCHRMEEWTGMPQPPGLIESARFERLITTTRLHRARLEWLYEQASSGWRKSLEAQVTVRQRGGKNGNKSDDKVAGEASRSNSNKPDDIHERTARTTAGNPRYIGQLLEIMQEMVRFEGITPLGDIPAIYGPHYEGLTEKRPVIRVDNFQPPLQTEPKVEFVKQSVSDWEFWLKAQQKIAASAAKQAAAECPKCQEDRRQRASRPAGQTSGYGDVTGACAHGQGEAAELGSIDPRAEEAENYRPYYPPDYGQELDYESAERQARIARAWELVEQERARRQAAAGCVVQDVAVAVEAPPPKREEPVDPHNPIPFDQQLFKAQCGRKAEDRYFTRWEHDGIGKLREVLYNANGEMVITTGRVNGRLLPIDMILVSLIGLIGSLGIWSCVNAVVGRAEECRAAESIRVAESTTPPGEGRCTLRLASQKTASPVGRANGGRALLGLVAHGSAGASPFRASPFRASTLRCADDGKAYEELISRLGVRYGVPYADLLERTLRRADDGKAYEELISRLGVRYGVPYADLPAWTLRCADDGKAYEELISRLGVRYGVPYADLPAWTLCWADDGKAYEELMTAEIPRDCGILAPSRRGVGAVRPNARSCVKSRWVQPVA